MKLAVTTQHPDLDSPVDPRFGRAPYFLLIDTETDAVTVYDNHQNLSAVQGAGIQAAQLVSEAGAQAVLTGHVGPKAFATLQAGQIAIYAGVAGTVRQALEKWRAGQLQPAATANVEGHWS